jgi:hypothetical protein
MQTRTLWSLGFVSAALLCCAFVIGVSATNGMRLGQNEVASIQAFAAAWVLAPLLAALGLVLALWRGHDHQANIWQLRGAWLTVSALGCLLIWLLTPVVL